MLCPCFPSLHWTLGKPNPVTNYEFFFFWWICHKLWLLLASGSLIILFKSRQFGFRFHAIPSAILFEGLRLEIRYYIDAIPFRVLKLELKKWIEILCNTMQDKRYCMDLNPILIQVYKRTTWGVNCPPWLGPCSMDYRYGFAVILPRMWMDC